MGVQLTRGERSLNHRAAFTPTGHSETPISCSLRVSVKGGDGGEGDGAGGRGWGAELRQESGIWTFRGLN